MHHPEKKEGVIRIASFDIGKKNFAQYVEDMSTEELEKLEVEYKSLPKTKQRRIKGAMYPEIKNILERVYLCGTRVQTGVYDLRDDKTSDKLDMATRQNLRSHLASFDGLWETCDIFIIEQQFFRTWSGGKRSAGTEANVDAIKIGEAVIMYLLDNYPFKEVSYFGSQNKTQILGAPWKMSKPQRKKWAVDKAEEIYRLRGDEDMVQVYDLKDRVFRKRINTEEKFQEFLDTFSGKSKDSKCLARQILGGCVGGEKQKMDDVADVVVQLQAYKYRTFVAQF